MRKANYDKMPFIAVPGREAACVEGWPAIGARLAAEVLALGRSAVVVVEAYPGAHDAELLGALKAALKPSLCLESKRAFWPGEKIDALLQRDLGDDPVFGMIANRRLSDLMDPVQRQALAAEIEGHKGSCVLVYGVGASLLAAGDILVYADLARWEIQSRFRQNLAANLGVENHGLKASLKYKRAFYVDWQVCDRHKKDVFPRADFVLDCNVAGQPKLALGEAVREGLRLAVTRPFRVVPFFDPGPWGGQWMKEVCDLPRDKENYAWCFDCVPEENSLVLGFGASRFELPSVDLVYFQPRALLGEAVHGRFGDEFPIRFDFLDTMGGGNLSLQVHPLTEYIQKNFGMHYTQDESYYMLDAGPKACVYLGVKEDCEPDAMMAALQRAETGAEIFDAERYVEKWPAKKHDHFLIPAGTVHCSGSDGMVLEVSATPFNFTFKLWDWARPGLDGKPRPIHLEHGKQVIQWERKTAWTKANLVNCIEPLGSGEGWREERTGLHEREFIETRRHWFSQAVLHNTGGSVNVLNLIEGAEAIVESPQGRFEPFVVHYAETFIIPAQVGDYSIRPYGSAVGTECATLKASVRH